MPATQHDLAPSTECKVLGRSASPLILNALPMSEYKVSVPPLLVQKCAVCAKIQTLDAYRERKGTRIGRYTTCRTCEKDKQILRRAAMTPALKLYHYAKARAAKRKRDFNITPEDIVVPDICPVLLTPMKVPSLDRIDPTKGYIKGNVRVISHRANMLRNAATYDEMVLLLADAERIKREREQTAE